MYDIAKLAILIETGDIKKAQAELNRLIGAGRNAERGMTGAMGKITASARQASNGLTGLSTAFAGLVGALSAREFVQAADTFTNITSKLKLVTGSMDGAKQASEALFEVSQRTRQSFDETVTVYQRFANGTKELGISQSRLLAVVETVNKAVTLSGASAQSAQAALVQLGQGLASGTLRGEELNSVLEQTPALAQALADGLGVGIGELRAMGAAGEITAEKVITALEKVSDSVDEQFSQVALTVGQAFTKLENTTVRSIGQIDQATGATASLAQGLSDLADIIDDNTSELADFANGFAPFAEGGAIALGLTAVGLGLSVIYTRLVAINPYLAIFAATMAGMKKLQDFANSDEGRAAVIEEARKEFERLNAEVAKFGRDSEIYDENFGDVIGTLGEARDAAERHLNTLIAQNAEIQTGTQYFNDQEPVVQKATKTVKGLTAEQKSYVEKLKEKVALSEAEAKQGKELTAGQKERIKVEQQFGKAFADSLKNYFDSLDAAEEEIKIRKTLDSILDDALEQQKEEQEQSKKDVKSIKEKNDAIEEEIKRIGLKKDALVELERVQSLQKATEARAAGNEALAQEYERTYRLLGEKYQKEFAQAQIDANREMAGQFEDDLIGAFETAFLRGGDFAQSFKRAIESQFAQMVLRPVISAFVAPISGVLSGILGGVAGALGFSGAAAAATGGGVAASGAGALSTAGAVTSIGANITNALSVGRTAFQAVTGAFTNFAGLLESFGADLTLNSTGFLQTVGSELASFAQANAAAINTVSTAAGGLATVYGGIQLGRAISGGFSLNGGTGNSTVNAGAAAGGALAATFATTGAFAGPLGAALGAALGAILGGVTNRLFGRKAPQLVNSGLQGEFTNEGFEGVSFADFVAKGGLFRSDKRFTRLAELEEETSQAINDYITGVADAAKSGSRAIFADAEAAIENFAVSGRFSGSLESILTQIGDDLFELVIPNLEDFQLENEKLAETFVRLVSTVQAANDAAILLGQGLQFSAANLESALSLNTTGIEFFFENFVDDAEQAERRLAIFNEQLRTTGLDSLLSADTTRDQFAALVEGLDITTEAGQRQLEQLLAIAPLFDEVIKKREEENALLEQTTQIQTDLLAAIVGAAQSEIESLKQAREQITGAAPLTFGGILEGIFDAEVVAELSALIEQTLQYADAQQRVKEALEQSAEAAQEQVRAIEDIILGIQSQATDEFISAQERVAAAQANLAQQQQALANQEIDRQRQLAQAYGQAANNITDLLDSLRSPDQSFRTLLGAALGGDIDALNVLPQAAQQALNNVSGVSALDEARQRAAIFSGLEQARAVAEQNSVFNDPRIDPAQQAIINAQNELVAAQNALSEALGQANAVNAPLIRVQESLVEQYQSALAELATANTDLAGLLNQINAVDYQNESLFLLEQIEQRLTQIAVDAGFVAPIEVTPLPRIAFDGSLPQFRTQPVLTQSTDTIASLSAPPIASPIAAQSDNTNRAMMAELAALRAEVAGLRNEQRIGHQQIALNTGKVAKVVERIDDGDAILTRTLP